MVCYPNLLLQNQRYIKPALRQIISTPQASFLVRSDVGECMPNNWHYHPEIELLYIKRSTGTWLVGDYTGPFQSGDMLMIGANLPHCFRHQYNHLVKDDEAAGETICVKFEPEIFGHQFLNLPETQHIKALLLKCNHGLQLTGKLKTELAVMVEQCVVATPGKNWYTFSPPWMKLQKAKNTFRSPQKVLCSAPLIPIKKK